MPIVQLNRISTHLIDLGSVLWGIVLRSSTAEHMKACRQHCVSTVQSLRHTEFSELWQHNASRPANATEFICIATSNAFSELICTAISRTAVWLRTFTELQYAFCTKLQYAFRTCISGLLFWSNAPDWDLTTVQSRKCSSDWRHVWPRSTNDSTAWNASSISTELSTSIHPESRSVSQSAALCPQCLLPGLMWDQTGLMRDQSLHLLLSVQSYTALLLSRKCSKSEHDNVNCRQTFRKQSLGPTLLHFGDPGLQ